MRTVLDEETDGWGIRVSRVEVKNIKPPAEIEEVMTKQMRAERERRQTVLEAQAHKESVVSRAEGDKQAKLLAAEAERDAQIALAEGQAKAIKLFCYTFFSYFFFAFSWNSIILPERFPEHAGSANTSGQIIRNEDFCSSSVCNVLLSFNRFQS